MKITRLAHAGFIVDAGDHRLAVDVGDFTSPATTAALGKLDAVVASHGHPDHYYLPNVLAAAAPLAAPADVVAELPESVRTRTLRLGKNMPLAGFGITPTFADHGPKLSRPIENFGLVIEHAGRRIYYIGDSAVPVPPPPGNFDLVLISVDGTGFVFNAEEAVSFVQALGHRGKVVPIHDGAGDEPQHAERFAALATDVCEPVLIQPGESLKVGP
jgi:L-ascorbate metabolism protein UlaG (beta-lactamase superfamily)